MQTVAIYCTELGLFLLTSAVNSEFRLPSNTGQVLGTLFSGFERVCTETASEQPTDHSGLTLKAEEEVKVT